MAGRREDRRVRKTRSALKQALLELLTKRGYDSITVADITERADVGRSTFYSHYDSKEALLFSGFESWLVSLATAGTAERGGAGADGFRFSLPLLRHIGTQQRLFQALIAGGSRGRVRRRIIAMVAEAVRRELEGREENRRASREELDARAHTVAWAFLGAVSWWMESGRGWSAEQVDGMFQQATGRRAGRTG